MITSKPWIWEKVTEAYWETPAEEFFPIVKRWKEKGYTRALDLGCGTGRHAVFLAQEGFEVDALDLASDGIKTLEDKTAESDLKIRVQVGDMLELPYKEGVFDCIVAFHAIYHTDLAGLEKTLGEMRRVLKTGGEAFITLNSKKASAWEQYADKRIDNHTLIKTEGPEIKVPHTYLDHDEAIGLLKNFTVLKTKQIITYLPKMNKTHAHFYILIRKD